MTAYVRPAQLRDIVPVADAMRTRDVDEVMAASGLTPDDALRQSFEASSLAWTVCAPSGEPFAIAGVAPLGAGVGAPWMLATDEFARHTMFVLRHSADLIRQMHAQCPVLLNYVDCRNQDSLRYLKAVGFRFTGFEPAYGVERRPFLQFTRVSPCASPPRLP